MAGHMGHHFFSSRVLLCAVPLAATVVLSIPAAADGMWEVAYSFLCNADEIAVDSQHNVYVLDVGDYPRIKAFAADGEFLRESQVLDGARGFAIDDDDIIYIVTYNRDHQPPGWVRRFDLDFRPLGSWAYANGDLEMGFAVDAHKGIAYVGTANSLLKFTTDGVLLDSFEGGWWSVEIALDGTVWVAQQLGSFGLVRHYSPDGDALDEWYTNLPGESYSDAHDIALDLNQRVFVADVNAGLLKIFRANGKLEERLAINPYAVALDGDHVLYVGSSLPMQLMKLVYVPLSVQPTTWGQIKTTFERSR